MRPTWGIGLFALACAFILRGLWLISLPDTGRVTVHDRTKVSPGYNLFTSYYDKTAFLMNMDGKIVHTWSSPLGPFNWSKNTCAVNLKNHPLLFLGSVDGCMPIWMIREIYTSFLIDK